MIKIPVFLGEKGITSTSANHIANMAGEVITQDKEFLDGLQFYSTTIKLIGAVEETKLGVGNTKEDLDKIEVKLKGIASMHAIAAWMREAVKAKDDLLNQLKYYTLEQWAKENDKELPTAPGVIRSIDENDITEEMNVKELTDYLVLEAIASTFGKAIHNNGSVSKARKSFLKVISNPSNKEGSGRDTTITTHEPTVKVEEMESAFEKLQDTYRSYEKRLNSIKFDVRKAINEKSTKMYEDYQKAQKEYTEKYNILRSEFEAWKVAKREEISKLKVIIPKSLQETFNYLNTLGKVSES